VAPAHYAAWSTSIRQSRLPSDHASVFILQCAKLVVSRAACSIASDELNIAFLTRRAWPSVGGVESLLRNVTLALADTHCVTIFALGIDDGHSTRVDEAFVRSPGFEQFSDGPVRVIPVTVPRSRQLMLLPLVSQFAPITRRFAYGRSSVLTGFIYSRVVGAVIARRLAGFDVLHAFVGHHLAWAAVTAARSAHLPVVLTPFAHPGQWGDDPASAHAYRAADRVVALLQDDAATYRGLGVEESATRVIPVCSPGAATGVGRRIRDRYGIAGPLVVFLGSRRGYKGHDVLAAAIPLVAQHRGDVTFAFVGPGEPMAITKRERVFDAGRVSDEEKNDWLAAADLLCLPSLGEIFPVAILEAWSAGTPALVSDIPPLVELVSTVDGGQAIARTPDATAAAIIRLLADPDELRAMGERGRRWWQAYATPSAVAAQHAQLYAELLSGGRQER
jgi:phosphatidylinositol alpha-1,6-mannosyltransferase